MLRRLPALALVLLLAGFGCLHLARSQTLLLLGAGKGAAAVAGYAGPGDFITGKAAYVMRAYNSADRGNALANVCIPADVACADVLSDATTGNAIVSNIGGSSCSIVICTIKTWYDRSGANQCSAAPCNITNATEATRPVFTPAAQNGFPCATFNNTLGLQAAGNITSIAQPFAISTVAKRTGTTASRHAAFGVSATTIVSGFNNSTGKWFIYTNGSIPQAPAGTITENAFHAVQGTFNGASSIIMIDGSSTTGLDLGNTNAFAATIALGTNTGFNLVGVECEAVLGTSINDASMDTNQRTYWGF